VLLLVGLALALVACGQMPPAEDNGPNAQLSNDELVAQALTNTGALQSHHVDFVERSQDPTLQDSPVLTITGDVQTLSRGSRFWIRIKRGTEMLPDSEAMTIEMFPCIIPCGITIANGTMYVSSNGGRTWQVVSSQALDPLIIVPFVYDPFGPPVFGPDKRTLAGSLLQGATLSDGSPRLDTIGGVATRHIVADLARTEANPPSGPWYQRVKTIDLWISTESSPTVRQMRTEVTGSRGPVSNDPGAPPGVRYSLTWQWSRLNEDFGTIPAPSLGTPTPPAPPPGTPTPPAPPPTPTPVPPPASPTPAPLVGMPRTGGAVPGPQSLLTLTLAAGLGAVLVGVGFYRSRRRCTGDAA
jgi:hypothetical protein